VGGWYVEQRKVAGSGDLSADIARHLQLRCTAGPAVIITDRPVVFLSCTAQTLAEGGAPRPA